MNRTLIALILATASVFAEAPTDTQQVRMVPAVVPQSSGKINGFRFVELGPDSIYAKLGFKKGDILKSVNGDKIDSPKKSLELYNSLKDKDRTNVVIERDGHERELTLQGTKN